MKDSARKAMFARLNKHVIEQNYDGLKRWHDNNKSIYGDEIADKKLYRKFQFIDRKIKEHDSMEDYHKDMMDKKTKSYFKAQRNATAKRREKSDAKIIAKWGSLENEAKHYIKKHNEKVAFIKEVRASPKLAKANQNYALTGSKYYKENMANHGNPDAPYLDSVHCPNCSQRLGNSIDACPICPKESRYDHYRASIYGHMLKNPSDPRWLLPKYNNNKFAPNENLHAESSLSERRQNAGNLDDLI